jgi:hypothetical protein
MNKYMKQFPLSGCTRQEYIDPKYKNKWSKNILFVVGVMLVVGIELFWQI